jgi:hypothetical protein
MHLVGTGYMPSMVRCQGGGFEFPPRQVAFGDR